MKLTSPLANFVEVLKQVNDVAVQHSAKLMNNEAATRASLVDPILNSLGWDLANPDMVELEKSYNGTKLDYGLMDSSGQVCIIVEAKALGVNLSDPTITAKIFSYGFNYGIQNIILTDGIIWQHYLKVLPGNIIPECIDISKDDPVACGDFFVSKVDACRFQATQPFFPPIQNPTPAIPTVPTGQNLGSTSTSNFTPLSALPSNLKGHKQPKSLRLPDGTVVATRYWLDILSESAKFVIKQVPNILIPLPDKAGKKTSLISDVAPAPGYTYATTTLNGKTIYIFTNYDSHHCVANAIYILGFLPKNKTWQTVEAAF